MFYKKRIISMAALAIVAAILFFGVYLMRGESVSYQSTDYAMSTVIRFQLYSRHAKTTKNEMMKELKRLEYEKLSWRRKDSEVAKINQVSKRKISVELYEWLKQINQIEQDSNGALDITVLPVAKLWNIEGENPKVPPEDKIKKELSKVNYENILLEPNQTVSKKSDCQIDIGAVGKGIACDKMARIMEEKKVSGGIVSIGGSVCVKGQKPDNSSWNIGIQNPRADTGEIFAVYHTNDNCFLSTSGDYEKYFMQDNIRYHHIINPATGYPADSGLMSVTVISDSGLVSDALSTACFILGAEKGKKLADEYNAKILIVDKDKNVYASKEIKSQIDLIAQDYTWREW